MNVARVCRAIPAHMPHELLGYRRDDLPGMLLTKELVNKVIEEENEHTSDPKGQKARIAKFNRLK